MGAISAILEEVALSSEEALWDYLVGASHDGTISKRHGTLRISQKESRWLEVLKGLIERLGRKSWTYREGDRDVWVIESSIRLPVLQAPFSVDFARGFFDAEGGIPRVSDARFYIQLVQKNHSLLADLRASMIEEGLSCGVMHNPSARADPDYWRFYIRARSWAGFAAGIGSWHPRKRAILQSRFSAVGPFHVDRQLSTLQAAPTQDRP